METGFRPCLHRCQQPWRGVSDGVVSLDLLLFVEGLVPVPIGLYATLELKAHSENDHWSPAPANS